MQNLFRKQIHQIRTEEPERYKAILEEECPHHYGLPSFDKDGRCLGHNKCPECWQEALKYEFQDD